MDLHKAFLILAFLAAFAQGNDGDDDDDYNYDDYTYEGGRCFYDEKCRFSCGEVLDPDGCINYLNTKPGSIPIDIPYYQDNEGGECQKTSDAPKAVGSCCSSCDIDNPETVCTVKGDYYNPEGCAEKGIPFFFDKIKEFKQGNREGVCHQVCGFEDSTEPEDSPDPRTASGSGDPHFKTWTGDKFDYHGECDLVLVDNPSFDNGKGLKVHIRTTRIKYFSYIEKIGVQIGEDVLEFANDVENFLINGKKVEKRQKRRDTLLGGFVVRRDRRALSIRLHGDYNHRDAIAKIDLHVRATGFPAVVVSTGNTNVFKGSLGLLGDWETGRKLARDGVTEIGAGEDGAATTFALEWQVRDTEPMLFQEARFPQFPTTCTPPEKMMGNRLGGSHMRAQAEEACAKWKQDKEDCIFDVMATRDVMVAMEGAVA